MGKNRSASGLTNIIQYDDSGNITFVSGSTTLMSVSSSGAITTTGTISGSDATNALLLNGTGSLAFTTTASYNVASASLSSRTTQVERTYASTGSNTFTGAQFVSDTSNAISFTSTASLYSDGGLRVQGNSFVSGTAYFNNIVVYGTSSIQYITSSQVNVGTNIITVNTDTPAVRFGGLAVFDSGSTQLTGSILWDSEKNHWIYSNPSGSTYSGGMLISGPRSSALGSEQGTTSCMLLVGQGGDHLTSSLVYHSSTCTSFYSNTLFVSSSGNVGIGVTPSASDTFPALQVGRAGFMGAGNDVNISANAYYSSPSWKYIATESSALYNISGNIHSWYSAASGTANGAISWIERMRITCTGNVGIGACTPTGGISGTETALEILNSNVSVIALTSTSASGKKYQMYSSNDGGLFFRDGTSSVQRMMISTLGNIGIGTTSPFNFGSGHRTLDVRGDTNSSIGALFVGNCDRSAVLGAYINPGAGATVGTSTNHYLQLVTCDVERVRITSNGIACFTCPISVGFAATIGTQGGTDTTVIGGGSGVGSTVRMNYAGGTMQNLFQGNGDNFVNCVTGKLNAAGGIKFANGATTLNYYEQGTWTPRLKNGSFTTNAGTSNKGWYTRIGNLVTVGGTLDWGAGSGAQDGNSLQITCLPFASSNADNERNVGQPGAPAANSIGFKCAGKGQLVLVNDPGNVFIYLIETFQDGSYTTYIHNPLVSNAGTIYGFQITYHI
jgi:hypothetical protein